ncbi:MAG: sugar phosphate isomerase/epimerase, partial [Aquirufa sp.]
MNRRHFISAAALASAAPAVSLAPAAPELKPKIKLSVSSYSYWHFKGDKFPIEKVIDEAAKLGLDGIDVLHRQMESEDNAYLQKLK